MLTMMLTNVVLIFSLGLAVWHHVHNCTTDFQTLFEFALKNAISDMIRH